MYEKMRHCERERSPFSRMTASNLLYKAKSKRVEEMEKSEGFIVLIEGRDNITLH
jgi:hypothetical protein